MNLVVVNKVVINSQMKSNLKIKIKQNYYWHYGDEYLLKYIIFSLCYR